MSQLRRAVTEIFSMDSFKQYCCGQLVVQGTSLVPSRLAVKALSRPGKPADYNNCTLFLSVDQTNLQLTNHHAALPSQKT